MATKKTAPVKKIATAPKAVPAPAAPAPKAAKKAAPAPKVTLTVKPTPTPKAPAKKAPVKKAATAKAVAAAPAPTVIIAAVDVGFGNVLTIRGSGPGLSWDAGVQMACEGASEWTFIAPAGGSLTFKVLLNDQVWSVGEDYVAPSGQTTVIAPAF